MTQFNVLDYHTKDELSKAIRSKIHVSNTGYWTALCEVTTSKLAKHNEILTLYVKKGELDELILMFKCENMASYKYKSLPFGVEELFVMFHKDEFEVHKVLPKRFA